MLPASASGWRRCRTTRPSTSSTSSSPWDLTGLYHGTPINQRSVDDIVRMPDLIFLFRQPILAEWIETGEELYRLVASVLIHEIGHHFGFSDADIEAIEREMD